MLTCEVIGEEKMTDQTRRAAVSVRRLRTAVAHCHQAVAPRDRNNAEIDLSGRLTRV